MVSILFSNELKSCIFIMPLQMLEIIHFSTFHRCVLSTCVALATIIFIYAVIWAFAIATTTPFNKKKKKKRNEKRRMEPL